MLYDQITQQAATNSDIAARRATLRQEIKQLRLERLQKAFHASAGGGGGRGGNCTGYIHACDWHANVASKDICRLVFKIVSNYIVVGCV